MGKSVHFSNELTYVYVKNWKVGNLFFFRKTSVEKVFGDVLFGKKSHFKQLKCRFVNGQKIEIFRSG